VIKLWADLQDHVYSEAHGEGITQLLHDGFGKLMSRRDISDRDRLWLRWLAESDPFWRPMKAEPPAIA